MPRTPDQQAQEEILKALVENDDVAQQKLARKYGRLSSDVAINLQSANEYFDPETPHRIRAIFDRTHRLQRTASEVIQEQELNAAEDGTGHGYKGKGE